MIYREEAHDFYGWETTITTSEAMKS